MKNALLAMIPVVLCVSLSSFGQTYSNGKVVRIKGAESRLIDCNNDAVTITLWTLNLTKTAGVLRKDKSLGITVKATIEGSDAVTHATQRSTSQAVFLGDVTQYTTGQIALPIEGSVLSNYYLKSGNTTFTNINLDIWMLRNRTNTGFGFVVKGLAKLTKDLPFPTTPFDPAIKSLTSSLSSFLDDTNDDSNGITDKPALGSIAESFNKSAMGLQTSTGMFAIVFGADVASNADGYIDPANTSKYTLSYQTEPTRAVLVAYSETPNNKMPLLNDHLLFSVDAYNVNGAKNNQVTTLVEPGSKSTGADSVKKEIMQLLPKSYWFSTLDKAAQQKLLGAFGSELGAGGPTGSLKLNSNELLLRDYVNAAQRRAILGSTQIQDFPVMK